MPGAELPPTIPQELLDDAGVAAHELHLALPAPLRGWAPALMLWPVLDEHRYACTQRCVGESRGGDWASFCASAEDATLVEAGSEPRTVVFRPEWAPVLELGLQAFGGREVLRKRLVDGWSPDLEPLAAPDVLLWACQLHRWRVAEEAWIQLNAHQKAPGSELLRTLIDLPLEARVERPVLTWATNAAAATLAAQSGGEPIPAGLMLDAAMLHANWSTREDTDTAIDAGTLRMLGQRRQPSTHPVAALDAAWRTKVEIDAFIDSRSREGRAPSRRTQAFFRVFSAQLALFRANPADAIIEARWAEILADVEQVRVMARGVAAFALSISIGNAPEGAIGQGLEEVTDPFGVRGIRGMGQAFGILASGNRALRRLDRAGVEQALAAVSSGDAAFAGIWAVRAGLEAFRDGFWGNLGEGIDRLTAEIAHRSRLGREQDELLGAAIIGRARAILLTKSGAFGAAARSIDGMPPGLKALPQARIHLWAGQFDRAIAVADAAAYDEGHALGDRHLLLIVKAAAALLSKSSAAELRAAALKELAHLIRTENFVPIGVLPKLARDAILDLCRPELGGEPSFALLLQRLAELNDAGDRGIRPLRLTEREQVLLPMLATDLPVPEIARRLQVSVNTVRKQVVTLREKFTAESRAELIRKARAYGALQ